MSMINKKVKVKDDVDFIGGCRGVVVGEGEDGWVYGKMWEVEFENGGCEFMMECDLEVM